MGQLKWKDNKAQFEPLDFAVVGDLWNGWRGEVRGPGLCENVLSASYATGQRYQRKHSARAWCERYLKRAQAVAKAIVEASEED